MRDEPAGTPADKLQAAVAANDPQALARYLTALEPAEAVHVVSHLSDMDQSRLLKALPRADAAKLVDDLPEVQAAQMIERLPTDEAAAIVSQLPSNEQANVMAHLSELEASAILDAMPMEDARDARRLLAYPAESAGGLMITDFLAYRDNLTVSDVLDDLRVHADRYRRFDVQYAYVVSNGGKLSGVPLLAAHRPALTPNSTLLAVTRRRAAGGKQCHNK